MFFQGMIPGRFLLLNADVMAADGAHRNIRQLPVMKVSFQKKCENLPDHSSYET